MPETLPLYIAGELVKGSDSKLQDVVNPATGEVIARVFASSEDVSGEMIIWTIPSGVM